MSNNTPHPHVRIVDATFEEQKRVEVVDVAPDTRALQAKAVKDIALALAPVAGVIYAGFALHDAIQDLVKHAKRNAARRRNGGR